MIAKPTVFVVGAGASNEFGFPLGSELTTSIRDCLQPPQAGSRADQLRGLFRACCLQLAQTTFVQWEVLERARHAVSRALIHAPSIDVYLDSRRDEPAFGVIGKLGIAIALLECEHSCKMRVMGNSLDHVASGVAGARGTWLARLFMMMVVGARRGAEAEILQNVAFVVFNYDRCIEHFFQIAMTNYFAMEPEEAIQLVERNLKIVHVYGSLGPLPLAYGAPLQVFGQKIEEGMSVDRLLTAKDGLRTFTEAHQSNVVEDIRRHMDWAEIAMFLGFGFHHQNVEILRPVARTKIETVLATAMGTSPTSQAAIKDDIRSIVGGDPPTVMLHDMECRRLIDAEAAFLTR